MGKRIGGRQKGTPNKASAAKVAAIAASGLTPLDFMLNVMRDELETPERRFEAAKAAAPYVHPKLATTVVTGKDGGPVQFEKIVREIVRA